MRSIFFMTKPGKRPVSPIAQKLLDFHGIEATAIKGTGKGGSITKKDVDNYLKTSAPAEEEE